MFDIVGRRFWFFFISGIIILIGIVSLLTFGLKAGIEFNSGSRLRVSFDEQEVSQEQLRQELANLGYPDAIIESEIKPTGEQGDFFIRTRELVGGEKTEMEAGLAAKFGDVAEKEFSAVSPEIAEETTRTATIAVAVAAIGILFYVTWAFRRMPKPLHYGTCAIIALAHDALVTLGVFSILGGILNWQIDLKFIIGVLAVIGYSVNNTVVIFDRIRENLIEGISPDFEVVVNNSLVETLSRSLNTSLTTMLVVLALLLFVGVSIQNFVVVLVIGIIAGTFSSIGIAPTLLVVWEKGEWGRFIQWLPVPRAKARSR